MPTDKIPAGAIPLEDYKNLSASAPMQLGDATEEVPEGAIPAEEYNPKLEEASSLAGQAKTFGEAVAHGFAGPLATGAEKIAGMDMEAQRLREEENPWTHGIGEAVGLIGGLATGVGELGLVTKGSQVIAQGAKLGRVASGALRGAIEMAALDTSDEITKTIRDDPGQTAETALAHIGLSTALGGVGGALFSKFAPAWMQEHGGNVDKHLTEFKNALNAEEGVATDSIAENAYNIFDTLKKVKPIAPELEEIGAKRGWPIMEGMVSDAPQVQAAEDSLISGNIPTYAGIQRQQAYRKAYDTAVKDLNAATESTAAPLSEREVGNQVKGSMMEELNRRYEPIKQLYDHIEPYSKAIPFSDKSKSIISRNIESLIKEKGVIKGGERHNFIKKMAEGVGDLENLLELKNFRSEVTKEAGLHSKDLAAEIVDKLDGVEYRAIKRFAETMKTGVAKDKILDLIDKADLARSSYREFRGTLAELGNAYGKKKIYGPQNFMDFLEDMNPQVLASRSFSEKNTEFAMYLAKEFPREMEIIRGYERNSIIAANKEPKALLKKISKMQPELQKILYNPEELSTIQDAHKYLDNFPKSFNPSGTAHTSALREFFKHPMGAVSANSTDLAIRAFIKATSMVGKDAEKEAPRLLQILAPKMAELQNNPAAFKEAVQYAMAAIKGAKAITQAATNIFSGQVTASTDKEKIEDLDNKLKRIQDKPADMFNMGEGVAHYMPNHGMSVASTTMNAVNYLNQARPQAVKNRPLDKEMQPTKEQQSKYMRQLSIAQNPLIIMGHIKNGTLLTQDIQTLQSVYPGYYRQMQKAIMAAMVDHTHKDKSIPYKTRQSMSLFMGEPLDSTMTPMAIQAIQGSFMRKQQQMQQQGQPKKSGSTKNLDKMTKGMMTGSQSGEFNRVKG